VWFLIGNYSPSLNVEAPLANRTCAIPRDAFIFVPLSLPSVAAGLRTHTCEWVSARVAEQISRVTTDRLSLELDGKAIGKAAYRFVNPTSCFDYGVRMEPPERTFPSAIGGYYVLLKPLSPGSHSLSYDIELDGRHYPVAYTLVIP
jgi:hypothetical protein